MARQTKRSARRPAGRATASGRSAIDRAIEAAITLARTQGWRDTTLADIAENAGLSLGEMRREVGGKTEILIALVRRADAAMLDGAKPEGESVRDRLFELVMRRLDALASHKDGLKAVVRDLPRDPASLLLLGCSTARSMGWLLEAAGVDPHGPLGRLRTKALGAIYLATLRTWLRDEGTDSGKTMEFLDRALRRAESLAAPFSRRTKAPEASSA
jgi:AcrR family transcriptional regulator